MKIQKKKGIISWFFSPLLPHPTYFTFNFIVLYFFKIQLKIYNFLFLRLRTGQNRFPSHNFWINSRTNPNSDLSHSNCQFIPYINWIPVNRNTFIMLNYSTWSNPYTLQNFYSHFHILQNLSIKFQQIFRSELIFWFSDKKKSK